MQYSQGHLKTMVYAKFGGANRVYYGELENREYLLTLYIDLKWYVTGPTNPESPLDTNKCYF